MQFSQSSWGLSHAGLQWFKSKCDHRTVQAGGTCSPSPFPEMGSAIPKPSLVDICLAHSLKSPMRGILQSPEITCSRT